MKGTEAALLVKIAVCIKINKHYGVFILIYKNGTPVTSYVNTPLPKAVPRKLMKIKEWI